MLRCLAVALVVLSFVPSSFAAEPIRFVRDPALSPDGSQIAFEWNGDVWLVPAVGGEARQFTAHPGKDTHPKFSPDGKSIAFLSDREGAMQVFVAPIAGGTPKQLTFHTSGYEQLDWTPKGDKLLVKATRDHSWTRGERQFLIDAVPHSPETLLFDDYGANAQVSPDGKKVLFTREGEPWWRKGYQGSRASQIWMYDVDAKSFDKVLHKPRSCRWPMWKPDGLGFYYVEEQPNGSNLFEYDFAGKASRPLTTFEADSVVFPAIARDGSAIVFRHLFDLYSYSPSAKKLVKLDVCHNADRPIKTKDSRQLWTATNAVFSSDGLEIAFIAGGDLWVMDTELREPIQVTKTPNDESNPLITPDGKAILFVQSLGDKFAICRATRKDNKKFWWQNRGFTIERLAEFAEQPTKLKLSPDGKKLAYVRGIGDLWIADLDLKKPTKVLPGWSVPDYDWSPDGQWIVHATYDNDFNRDVWIMPAAGGKGINVSRHPFNESMPVWSPDGKMVAFTGYRASTEGASNVAIVYLKAEDEEKTSRDRKLEKALDKMKGRPLPAPAPAAPPVETPKADAPKAVAKADGKLELIKIEPAKVDDVKKSVKDEKKEEVKKVAIDWDGLHDRIHRVWLGDGTANALFWSPDSKKLAFAGSYEGKAGTYAIDAVGDSLTPKLLTSTVGTQPVWLKQGNHVVWLVQGVPTSTALGATAAAAEPAATAKAPGKGVKSAAPPSTPAPGGSYTFLVRQDLDLPGRHGAVFDECWRIMRDHWYDARLNNRDWNAVREKYLPMARAAADVDTVTAMVQMMLGELNGSHLGFNFYYNSSLERKGPTDVTPHLGVRFDYAHAGPGLKIRDVLPSGPADKSRSKLRPGEIIVTINGTAVDLGKDLPGILNGPLDRELTLTVLGVDKKLRDVDLRPISQLAAHGLLYEQWLDHNRKLVDKASDGKLGYLHISQMSMPTFRKFEEELVSQGTGKDGLVIDVRENPGGSTADHLLTALTQPVHSITVPRGGGQGYPHDRKIYETWNKPIVVLCNQNSGSNAEIFSHAIKILKRGQLVGVPTAGAVISTGSTQVMDAGLLRLPFRGWFTVNDGLDMEKNGAAPHHLVWPQPGNMPQGRDEQLTKAIEVLLADVEAWRQRPQPKLKYSTE